MTTDYAQLKQWRQKSKKNARYNLNFMREKRAMYRRLYPAGKIAYHDVPRSYRYWADTQAGSG